MFAKFTIICECGHVFERVNIANPKTLRTWVCPRQHGFDRAAKVTRRFNIDGHRTRAETISERLGRLLDVARNGWEHERYAAAAQLRKEGTFHVEP